MARGEHAGRTVAGLLPACLFVYGLEGVFLAPWLGQITFYGWGPFWPMESWGVVGIVGSVLGGVLLTALSLPVGPMILKGHLVRGIHPPVLAERGLDGAVRALAMSLPLPVDVSIDVPGRADAPVESAAYFAVAEMLANVVKHSGANRAWVQIAHSRKEHGEDRLQMIIGADGVGGADPDAGGGMRDIERRLAAFDGTMAMTSSPCCAR